MQAYDDDGAIESVQFYINGLPYGDKVFRPQNLTDEEAFYQLRWSPGASGIYSIHGIATDSSGNSVATTVITVTATTGTNPPNAKIAHPFDSVTTRFTNEDLEIELDLNDGIEIVSIAACLVKP